MADLFRMIVAGDRRLEDYALVKVHLDRLLEAKLPDVVILSGGARGADALGERYAQERSLPLERYPADWQTYGKRAGPIRNEQMVLRAHALVCFDGGGPGSRNVILLAQRHHLLVRVIRVKVGRGGGAGSGPRIGNGNEKGLVLE